MKFFCVFLICIYVRTAYSYYTGSAGSYNPSDSPILPITPEFQPSSVPINVQNAYSKMQDNVGNQPRPIQQEYRIGPGLPMPYQIDQTARGIQNNVQMNRYPNQGKFSPHASAIQHIQLHPQLKEIYKKSIPTKRYTIVHPNGTIEYTDEIHTVTARYPKYLMVKAADILAHVNRPNVYKGITQNPPPGQLNKPITARNQNFARTSTNSFEKSHHNQLHNNDFRSSVVPNVNPVNQRYPNQNNQELYPTDVPSNPKVVALNPAATVGNELDIKRNIEEVNKASSNIPITENIRKEEINKPSVTKELHSNVVAANPLPIYTAATVNDTQEKHEQPPQSPSANVNVSNNPMLTQGTSDAVTVSNSNSVTDVENPISAINRTRPRRPVITVEVPADIDERKTLQVILPEILRRSIGLKPQAVTTIEEPKQSKDTVTPEVTTIEEPITAQNANVTDTPSSSNLVTVLAPNAVLDISQPKDTADEDVQSKNTSNTPTNTTNTTDIIQEPHTGPEVKSNSTIPSVSVFTLSEDKVWEAIKSNASNVYFFFLPPKPKRYKETRTTIFPNGTKIEEIIERDVDRVQDEQPKVTKNTTKVSS